MTILELLPTTERETLKFRLLALLIVAIGVGFRVEEVPLLPLYLLVLGYLFYSFLLRTVLIPRFVSYPLLGVMLVVDAFTLLAAVYLVGPNSPVVVLLPISVVYYALYQGYLGGLLMATVNSLGFVGLIYFVLDRLQELANLVAIQVPSLYLLALLVGYIAQQRFRESEERSSLQQMIQTEIQARRLLQVASSLRGAVGEGLSAEELARVAAAVVGLPWAALFVTDSERTHLQCEGANYAPADGSFPSIDLRDESILSSAWREGREIERRVENEEIDLPWAPAADPPLRYLLAIPLHDGERQVGVLAVLGSDQRGLSDQGRQALGAFANLAVRVLVVGQVVAQAQRRSQDLAAELQTTVETAGRFAQLQQRRVLQFGDLVIDAQRERVRRGQTVVHLSRTESDLLYVLADKSGTVLNPETILRAVWGEDYVPQGKPVDVAIHRLRRKLNTLPGGAQLVRTVRGRGYTFVPPDRVGSTPQS